MAAVFFVNGQWCRCDSIRNLGDFTLFFSSKLVGRNKQCLVRKLVSFMVDGFGVIFCMFCKGKSFVELELMCGNGQKRLWAAVSYWFYWVGFWVLIY